MLKNFLIVGLGSFFGGGCRFLLQKFISSCFPSPFPFAIFFINVLGCLLIGIFYGVSNRFSFIPAQLSLFFTTGFCGGLTTFSTFTNDGLNLINKGLPFYFLAYIFVSVFLGIFATFTGYWLTKQF